VAGAFLAAATVPANAASLKGLSSAGANLNSSTGGPTGNFLSTWYDIGTPVGANPHTELFSYGTPNGDNLIRLVEPNGCGNGGVGNGNCGFETDQCVMIYVFDDDQEMGECCGCRITPNELETFSVRNQLVGNWALATQDNSQGSIIVVGSSVNAAGGCNPNNRTCNSGCDPTLTAVTSGASNLQGSITHDQLIAGATHLTETGLFDQGEGESTNNAFLATQCASLNGNSSHHAGFCYCEGATLD